MSFNNLVNLFNSKGLDSKLYGPHSWDGINCNFSKGFPKIDKDDVVIFHFLAPYKIPKCSKLILSCHETQLYPIKSLVSKGLKYDDVHFVSEFQKEWHGVDGKVIPNPIEDIRISTCDSNVAGIIGSIDRNKRVDVSIKRALKDGHTDIRMFGNISDMEYFQNDIVPLMDGRVSYRGVFADKQKIYDQVSCVYHSPKLETFNLIKPECKKAGVAYHGHEGNDTQAEYWDNERIYEEWESLITN